MCLGWAAAGCRSRAHAPSYIDLIHQFPSAQKRSALAPAEAFALLDAEVGGAVKSSLRTCGASRITWSVRLPRNAVLRTAIAPDRSGNAGRSAVALRIGISDRRRYEGLFRHEFAPAPPGTRESWQPVTVSLSAYSGWQWSLFYRPWETTWDLVFATDGAGCGYWAAPRIEMAK